MKKTKPITIAFGVYLVLYLLVSCSIKPKVLISENNFSTTPVKRWTCIGPFQFDTLALDPRMTFYNKDLDAFGIDETKFKKQDFSKLPQTVKPIKIEDKQGTVDLMSYATTDKHTLSNCYLFAEIESEVDKEVVFITDGSFAYKIWVNEELIVCDYWKKNTYKCGDRFIPVELKKGMNKIFVKVNRGTNVKSWKLNLTISDTSEAKKVFFDNCIHDFVANPNFTDTLHVYVGPYNSGDIELIDFENHTVLKKTFKKEDIDRGYIKIIETSGLCDGFYTAKLICKEYTMVEKTYKGDLFKLNNQILKNISTLNCDSLCLNEISAAYKKFNYSITQKPDSLSRVDKQYWKNNSVFHGYNLYNSLTYLNQKNTLKGCSGNMFKSYYSATEKKYFSYLFHCSGTPEEIASKPVILMIPWVLDENDFVTDCYYSNLDQIEIDMYLADKNGFSIAWPFLRGTDYSIERADIDVLGVIKSLITDYKIDSNSFFLDGDCAGGYRALLIASRNPDKFAGIAVHGPITQGNKEFGPINLVRNLYNVPACIVHGHEDAVVPIQQTKLYLKEAKKFGVFPELDEKFSKGKYSVSKAYHYDSFNKLKQLYKNSPKNIPTKIKYCTYEKENKTIYWLEFEPQYDVDLVEIVIERDTTKNVFNMKSKGIGEIAINTEMLKINHDTEITVISNERQVFKGLASLPQIRIKID